MAGTNTDTTGSEVSKAKQKAQEIQSLISGANDFDFAHNFEGSPIEVTSKLTRVQGGEHQPAQDLINKEFSIVNWCCHRVEFGTGDHDESQTGVRTVLFDGNGDSVQFGSRGVVASLLLIIQGMGPGPYVDGVNVIVRQITTGKKRQMLTLEVVAPGENG